MMSEATAAPAENRPGPQTDRQQPGWKHRV
jgi:hypothetical protein